MKHSGFAWIAAFSLSVLAAVTFLGCGKEEPKAVTGLGGAASSAPTVFDITTSRLEKGGIAFSFTDGAAAYQMVDKMFDSFDGIIPDIPEAKKIFADIRGFAGDELGLKTFRGCGTSVKKNGDYYRCIDFEFAPEQKGLFWDLIGKGASQGPAPELKLASPKSAVAISTKLEPGTVYAFIDKKLRASLDEDTMAMIDQQISNLHSSGIQPDKLLDCISGISFYVEAREFKEEDLQGVSEGEDPEAAIAGMIPKFALVFTTKSDLCWKALENFLSQSSPELVKDGKIVPMEGIAIFQAGNYLIATNDEAAIRDRIAGKGSDLTANAEFAKMVALADKDFSSFSWVSEDYFKMIASLTDTFGALAANMVGGAVPVNNPSLDLMKGLHSTLTTTKIDAEGLTFTTITADLQVALLNSGTVAGVITGILPYLGPITQSVITAINSSNDLEAAENLERQAKTNAVYTLLKMYAAAEDLPEIPAGTVFFTLNEETEFVFVKWDEAAKEFTPVPEDTEEDEFPFVFVTTPDAAAKAENPEETVVFYEDPTEFIDGIFVVFGDGSVKFLEGDFDDHTEALEAAANTFGLSEKAAAELIKKGAAIDKMLED